METILREKDFSSFLVERVRTISNLIFYHGLFQGVELLNWVDRLLARKLESATRVKFKDLPHDVRIYACRRDIDALIFDSKQLPEMSVAYAVRCSIAIPFFFTPERNEGLHVVDGGMRNNYPVKKLLEQTPDKRFIGLYLGDSIYSPSEPSLLKDLWNISTEANDVEALEKYRSDTVIIDPKPVSTLDFSLSSEEKSFLVSQGKAAALQFLYKRKLVQKEEMEAAAKRASDHKMLALAARSKRKLRKWLVRGGLLALFCGLVTAAMYVPWRQLVHI
jgi:predicted acylesterase/phospholipase RssA